MSLNVRAIVSVAVTVTLLVLDPRCTVGAPVNLSDWVGNKNLESTNNYSVLSPNSVGGIFQSRKGPAAGFVEDWYLRDASLEGGPLGFDEPLAMSGTMKISNPSSADPSWFFGWYSSTDYRYRLGFAVAQALNMPPNATRMRVAFGNGGATTTRQISNDGSDLSSKSITPDGTYDFTFSYTPGASNNLTVHIDPQGTDWRRINLPMNFSTPNVFDRFGFLQIGTTPATATFEVVISNLHYTGETQIPEPATWFLVVALAPAGLAIHRSFCSPART